MSKPFDDSKAERRALMLTPEAPYPLVGGGPIRTASLLEYLAKHYEVDVITFREPGSADPRASFPAGLVRKVHVIDLPYHSKSTLARATRNIGRLIRRAPPLVDRFSGFHDRIRAQVEGLNYDVGVIEHFWCAAYAEVLRPVCRRLVLDLHNIESILLSRCAAVERWPASAMLDSFATACRELESRWFPQFSSVLVTSAGDGGVIGRDAIVYPNAIPCVQQPVAEKRNEIVFSGNLEYLPNIRAVDYFAAKIWPLLRKRWPGLVWKIVGRNEHTLRMKLAGDNRVLLTGAVKDAIVELASARVAVVPVLSGSGTRIKILEAWAAGVPVVSTRTGAEGLGAIGGTHLLLADTPDDFSVAVSRLLESEESAAQVGAAGRQLYENRFTWKSAWRELETSGV